MKVRLSWRVLLIRCLFSIVISGVMTACVPLKLTADGLDMAMYRYAGPNSIYCGVVRTSGWEAEAVNQCVDAAYHAKKAFVVRYGLGGFDSAMAEGLASNNQGEIHTYRYDSDPSGGSHTGEIVVESRCHIIKAVFVASGERRGCEP